MPMVAGRLLIILFLVRLIEKKWNIEMIDELE